MVMVFGTFQRNKSQQKVLQASVMCGFLVSTLFSQPCGPWFEALPLHFSTLILD